MRAMFVDGDFHPGAGPDELEQLAPLFASDDAREGMTAFTEKRPAKYAGR